MFIYMFIFIFFNNIIIKLKFMLIFDYILFIINYYFIFLKPIIKINLQKLFYNFALF